jgi:dTDP-4-amino-4,6-dideoxygalactose transaminase
VCFDSFYRWFAFVRPHCLRADWSRDRVLAELTAAGVPCGTGACAEIYLEAAFPPELRPPRPRPTARALGETSLMFQVHPALERQHIEQMADAVIHVLRRATAPAALARAGRRSA